MTITKKNGKYYCRFQINGERHHYLCNGAVSVKEAKLMEDGFRYKLQQQQNGIIPRECKTRYKLKILKDNFLKYSEINRSVYKQDIGRLKIAFEFFKEDQYADSITAKDVEQFKAWMLSKGRSKKTINMYIGIFRIMYNLAIEEEWILKNPFISKVEFKLEPRKMGYLSDSAQPILDKVAGDDFRPIIITALNSALRRNNIIELKWSDFDFNFRTIEITKNKGNKHIKLPMNDVLYNLFMSMERKSEYVFINPKTGTKWSTTKFGERWREIREKAGLGTFRFHNLRHTVATRLVKNGVPLPIVRDVMTHSDIKTTMQYTHVDSLDMVNAMNVLNSYN